MPKDDKKLPNKQTNNVDKQAGQQDLDKLCQLASDFATWGRDPTRREELEAQADDESTRGMLKAMDYFGSRDPGESQRPGLEEGNIVEGTVTEVQDCSAFVDLGGGAVGLVHRSDLTWDNLPADEVVKVGEQVQVVILNNPTNSRVIHLSVKQLAPDPWDTAEERFPIGCRVEAVVNHVNKNGAWFDLAPAIQGYMSIGQFKKIAPRTDHLDVFKMGSKVTMTVAGVEPSFRQIHLTWKPENWEAGSTDDQDGSP